jgi:hypothetical protein
MTNPRILFPHRAPRFRRGENGWEAVDPRSPQYDTAIEFELHDDNWAAVEKAAGLPALTREQRREGSRVARLYICEMEDHRLGLPLDRFMRLKPRLLHALGFGASDHSEALQLSARSRPPAEAFALFINGLADLFEDVADRPPTVRNDGEGTSAFVRFVLALWRQLPIANRSSRSETQMQSRISALFRERGKRPS